MARKGDTSRVYQQEMQQELFEVLAGAKSPESWPTHRRVSRLNYSGDVPRRRLCRPHMKQGIPLAPGMEISLHGKGAKKWDVDQRGRLRVRCCVLSSAASEGLGRGSICFRPKHQPDGFWSPSRFLKTVSTCPLTLTARQMLSNKSIGTDQEM